MNETKVKKSPGRKPLSTEEKTVFATFRFKPSQREKLTKLGGAKWIRDKIDKAK